MNEKKIIKGLRKSDWTYGRSHEWSLQSPLYNTPSVKLRKIQLRKESKQASKESVIKAAFIQTHEHPLLLFALNPNMLALRERISDRKVQSISKSDGLWGDFPWKTQTYQARACLRQGKETTSDNLRLAQVSECFLSGNPTGLKSLWQNVLLNHRFKWSLGFTFWAESKMQK